VEVFLVLAVAALGCGNGHVREEIIGKSGQALSADTTRVFGFESLADWSGGGPLALSSRHDEGSNSLQVTSQGSVSVTSAKVAGPIAATSMLAVDVTVPHVQSPLWHGQAQVVLNAPSIGLYNEWIGAQALPFPYSIFQRVQFPISDTIKQKLGGIFIDLQVTISVTGGAGDYLLDKLRFITPAEATEPVARASNASIMDFEDPDLWVGFQPALLASSDTRIRGAHSLAVSNFTWTRLDSALLSSPIGVKPFLAFDLRIPSPQGQWWRGSLDLVASIPSLGLHDVAVGHQDLLPLPLDVLTRVVFPVSVDLQNALGRSYTDLSFAFVLNVPSGVTGAYQLDYLRFQANATAAPERPEVIGDGSTPIVTAPSPVDIPPLGGSGVAAVQSARTFIDWASGARASQVVAARAVIRGAAANSDVAQALINEVNTNDLGSWVRYLVTLSILGEMQTVAGEDFFLHIVDLPLPADPDAIAGHGLRSPSFPLIGLQVKAVDGLAFMRTPRSNAKLLQIMSQHPSRTVRVEAIRAYLDHGGARADVLAAALPAERIVADSFQHASETDPSASFDDQLDAYLAQHPSVGNPPNATQ
jgi:hypothetical protein